MPTTPTAPSAVPDFPALSDRATYNAKAYAWATHMDTVFPGEMQALATNVYNNAVEADADAVTATTKAAEAVSAANSAYAAANATNWVSGEEFGVSGTHPGVGDARISLLDFQSYRRKTVGGGTTDPKSDPVNWARVELFTNGGANVATIGTSLVLSSTAAKLQRLAASAPGLDVVLPNATSLSAGINVQRITNTGAANSIGVVNGSGAVLGYLAAGGDEVTYDLADNSSAGGAWIAGGGKAMAVIDTLSTSGSGAASLDNRLATYRTCELSANLGLASYLNSSGYPTVIAIDMTTGAMGTPLQVEAVTGTGMSMALFPLTATTALLVYNNLKCTVVSVTGTNCTTGNLLSVFSSYGLMTPAASGGQANIIKLSATLFLSAGGWSGAPDVAAITISGTTCSKISASLTAVSEVWSAFYDWVPLTATTALLTCTKGNGAPYTNYTQVVSVSAGVPSFGASIARGVSAAISPQPILGYSPTKVLQLIGDGTNIYTRVLTISGTTVTASAEQIIRSDTTEGAMDSYLMQVSPTHPDAYSANHYGGSLTSTGALPFWRLGGTYYACQSRTDVIDILNVDFAAGTTTKTTLTTASIVTTGGLGRCLTDNNTLLNFRNTGTTLTIGRAVGSSAGLTAQSDVTATLNVTLSASGAVVPGKFGAYLHTSAITLAVDVNGAIKGTAYPTVDQLKASNVPPLLQFSLNSRAYSVQVTAAVGYATVFRGL